MKKLILLALALLLLLDTVDDLFSGETLGLGAGKTGSGRKISVDNNQGEYYIVIFSNVGAIILLVAIARLKDDDED